MSKEYQITGRKGSAALRQFLTKEGATENAVVVKGLLEELVERGVAPGRNRLFVIDGGKALRAAWKLEPKEGMARLRTQIEWLERTHPKAAASLREGLEETFTINHLDLSPRLRKCLATTNVIESSLSGVEGRTGRVTRWRDGAMCLRWAAAAALETERNFRKIIGHEDLWMLKAVLEEGQSASNEKPIPLDEERVAA